MYDPRQTVDPKAIVPLRFDDPEFIRELETAEGEWADQLEAAFGVKPQQAATEGFEGFVDAEVTILARASVPGREDDDIATQAQLRDARKGTRADVGSINRARWVTWVKSLRVRDGAIPFLDEDTLLKLSSPNNDHRGNAFGGLPTEFCDFLMARLQVHIRHGKRGPLTDPAQTTPRPGKAHPDRGSSTSSGPSATAPREND